MPTSLSKEGGTVPTWQRVFALHLKLLIQFVKSLVFWKIIFDILLLHCIIIIIFGMPHSLPATIWSPCIASSTLGVMYFPEAFESLHLLRPLTDFPQPRIAVFG